MKFVCLNTLSIWRDGRDARNNQGSQGSTKSIGVPYSNNEKVRRRHRRDVEPCWESRYLEGNKSIESRNAKGNGSSIPKNSEVNGGWCMYMG